MARHSCTRGSYLGILEPRESNLLSERPGLKDHEGFAHGLGPVMGGGFASQRTLCPGPPGPAPGPRRWALRATASD
jgi:hypothetical protein